MADVELKDVAACRVVALRRHGPVTGVGEAFKGLFEQLMRIQAPLADAPRIGIFYGEAEDFDPENTTFDVCAILAGDLSHPGDLDLKELSAVRVASAMHEGPYHRIGPVYDAVFQWIGAQGLEVSGPVREVYVVAPGQAGGVSPEDYVTEVQVPVKRA